MRGLLVLAFAAALVGCKDSDQDGTRDGKDCAPFDASIHPDAKEVCNGKDDNCSGQVDEGVAIVAYWDRDRDGFGDGGFKRRVCEMPEDGSAVDGDCDDFDPTTHPDAVELCDLIDNDCDQEIDNGVADLTFYADADGDGYGDPGATIQDCIAPDGYVGNSDDCDDGEPTKWNGAPEVCDGIDNDCDGSIDEDLPDVRVFADADGDGSGDPNVLGLECGALPGWSLDDRDCDDTDPNLGGASEDIQGNGIDEDCDGYVDEYGVPTPYATWTDALIAIGGAGTGTEVIQFDDGFHQLNVDATGANVIFAGEGCGRTTIYANSPDPVFTMDGGTIEGMTLAGGTANRGGGLRVEGGEVWAIGICSTGNTADSRGGGAAVVDGGTLHLWDSKITDNRAEQLGGGVYGHADTVLDIQRTLIQGNEAATLWGGGIAIRGGHADILNTVVAGNTAYEMGGGIYVANELAPPPGDPYAPDETRDGSANIAYSTIHGNELDPVGGLQGQALLVGGTIVYLDRSVITGHPGPLDVLSTKDSNMTGLLADARLPFLFTTELSFRGNAAYDQNGGWFLGAVSRGNPDYVNVDPAIDPSDWDLRTMSESAYIDLIANGDLDQDGSPADAGAFGGPAQMWAPGTPLWRPWPAPDSVATIDDENDGLLDAWEYRWGSSLLLDDSGDDPDADGLTHADEQLLGTDPFAADTDGDGVDDNAESVAGSDPRDPSDNRPIAMIGSDRFGPVGSPVSLDGSASDDPNGDSLTYDWTLISTPFGSTAAIADPTVPVVSLTPDLPGVYELQLTVSDGQGFHSDTRWIEARTGVTVPDQAATIPDALGQIFDGEAIFVRAGTWGPVDLTGRSVAIVGLDAPDQVVLDAAGAGPVITATAGIALDSLTLTGGDAAEGGGIYLEDADTSVLRNLVIQGNVAGAGGGLFARRSDVDGSELTIMDNIAGEGGGVWGDLADVDIARSSIARNSAWDGGGMWLDRGKSHFQNVEVQSNNANHGAALWVGDNGWLEMDNCVSAANRGLNVNYSDNGIMYSLGVLWHEIQPDPAHTVMDGNNPGLWRPMNNHDSGGPYIDDTFWYSTIIPAAREPMSQGDPMVVSFIDDGDPSNDLLVPRAGSPLVDAGWPDFTDRDGTRSDIGLGGGAKPWNLGLQGQWDTDGDGLDDAWEQLFGLDPDDAADVTTDTDGDGWNALDEYVAGTSPNAADSDGDGVDDPTELAAGTDPTSAEADRPVAVATAPPGTRPGEVHQVDGSSSYDPVAGPSPLAYQWRVITVPPGSAVDDTSLSDPTAAVVDFVPDMGGRFVLGLTVSDSVLDSHETIVSVEPHRLLEVPTEYPTIDDAYAVAESGDVVLLAPGIHDLRVTDWLVGVSIEGYGPDQTFVHGVGGWPVFEIDLDEDVAIRDLTIAGGNGNYGGGVDCAYGTALLERVRFEFNASWEGGGMRANDCDVVLNDVDMLDNDVSSRGGAFTGILGSLTWTRGEVARNSSDAVGGAIYLDNVAATLSNLEIHHNESESGGAAINQVFRDAYPIVPQRLYLDHVTVVGNNGSFGALYLNLATITNSIIQENNNDGIYESNSDPLAEIDVSYTSISGNFGNPTSGDDILLGAGVIYEDARFLAFDALDGGGWTADLRIPLSSPAVDAGDPGMQLDLDGTITDLGAWAGPLTWTQWDEHLVDTDGDGMADTWEVANGLNPGAADGGSDLDGDGLSALFEHDLGTDPNNTDSDGDGVTDDVENLGGDDPTDSSDHAPFADPGSDITGAVVGITRGLNGSASSDPDGDPITAWSWSIWDLPGRSVPGNLNLTDTDTDTMTFVPDTPGTYTFSLVVTAGGIASEPGLVDVVVDGTVLVPEDYATVPDAVAGVADGGVIDIAAGTWPTVADLEGKSMTLIGAGQGATILDGEGLGAVLYGDNGEQLTVQDLTITGGLSAEGGGIHIEGSLGRIDLVDVTITGNSSIYGGGVYTRSGVLTSTRTRIVDNDSGRNGGGIYATGSNVDLFQTLVAGNLSTLLHGGGMNHFNGDLTVTNSIFADNYTLSEGGALYINGTDDNGYPVPLATSDILFDHVHFVHNTAESEASAVKFQTANVVQRSVLYAHNRGGDAAVMTEDDVNTFESFYSLAWDNDGLHYDLLFNAALIPFIPLDGDANGNLVDRDADLSGFVENADWTDDDWSLGAASSGIDAGDPLEADPDASPADIGAFGGPDGSWTP